MVTDSIGDFLTRIRNAQTKGLKEVEVPVSKMNDSILSILRREGFIREYKKDKSQKNFIVALKYREEKGVIHSLSRKSKPGRRYYIGYRDIPEVLSGIGLAIISTPKGVMSGKEARKEKVGGEYICELW